MKGSTENAPKRRPRVILVVLGIILVTVLALLASRLPFGSYELLADATKPTALPLDPASPWPKFRANALQNGRIALLPGIDPAARPWSYATGKGIFSSPVIDAEGTVYVGSADRFFYALGKDGSLKWRLETGGVIDSSALLDDRGMLYFGAGDDLVRAVDRGSGRVKWSFKAQDAAEMKREFGVELHNVSWFEGNVGMLPDGSILAPNDNHLVYVLDRETGARRGQYLGNEMVWSLPALNPATGRLFFGTDFIAVSNLFAYDYKSGKKLWTAGGLGSVAATPLVTGVSGRGAVVLGGFDGIVRAFAQDSGKQLWKFGTRDHIYASPAQLSDGTIIQPSADGSIYALDPRSGRLKWSYDTPEPIRSSPAVDGNDRIYVGTGDGRLLCLEPDGRLRWSYRCILEPRNDLNASPALGPSGVTIAGESGGIFFVPYDWPLSGAGREDPRGTDGKEAPKASDGATLVFTDRFGALLSEPPKSLDANQPITFSLVASRDGKTVLSALDRDSIRVTASSNPDYSLRVAANGRFLSIVPAENWSGPEGGRLDLRVRGTWTGQLSRIGLKFFGGKRGGAFDSTMSFTIPPRTAGLATWTLPKAPGDPGTVLELSRLAAPEPSMLPSWNQIGFDSLHYLAGLVSKVPSPEGVPPRALAWVIAGKPAPGKPAPGKPAPGKPAPGKPAAGGDGAVPDPAMELRFPLVVEDEGGLLTLRNYEGFSINFVGSWDMPFGFYRISGRLDPADTTARPSAALSAVALCDRISFYGPFLKLMGLTEFDTGRMTVFGGLEFRSLGPLAAVATPAEAGTTRFSIDGSSASVSLDGSRLRRGEHVYSLVLVDASTGLPLPLSYTKKTSVEYDSGGALMTVRVGFDKAEAKAMAGKRLRALFMVDTSLAGVEIVAVGP